MNVIFEIYSYTSVFWLHYKQKYILDKIEFNLIIAEGSGISWKMGITRVLPDMIKNSGKCKESVVFEPTKYLPPPHNQFRSQHYNPLSKIATNRVGTSWCEHCIHSIIIAILSISNIRQMRGKTS